MRGVSFVVALALAGAGPVGTSAQPGGRSAEARFAIFSPCPEDGFAAQLRTAVARAYDQIDNAPEEKERGRLIQVAHDEYEAVGCRGRGGFLARLVTGAIRPHTVIATVTAAGGVAAAREQLLFAARAGLPRAVVFVDGALDDFDAHALKLALADAGFDPAATPIIRRTAAGGLMQDARAARALIAVTQGTKPPAGDVDGPFLMPVAAAHPGGALTGRVERGAVRAGDPVAIVGASRETIKAVVSGVEISGRSVDEASAGQTITLRVGGADGRRIERGMVAAAPATVAAHRRFKGQAYILTKEEGGRSVPPGTRAAATVLVHTAEVAATIEFAAKRPPVAGETVAVDVRLAAGVPFVKGLRFAIREGGRTVGAGVVAEIIE